MSPVAGVAAINGAGNEAAGYFQSHPGVKDTITRRVTIIRAEIDKICHTPDAYVRLVTKSGLAGGSLAQATTAVKTASQKAGGQTDGDAGDAIQSARTTVRGLLAPKQAQTLDGLLAGK